MILNSIVSDIEFYSLSSGVIFSRGYWEKFLAVCTSGVGGDPYGRVSRIFVIRSTISNVLLNYFVNKARLC